MDPVSRATGPRQFPLRPYRRGLPARIVRLDLASGREEPLRDFVPADPTGIVDLMGVRVTRDARYYAYSYGRVLSDLYVVEGLK